MIFYYQVYFGLLLLTLVLYLFQKTKQHYAKMIILLMCLWLITSATAIFLSSRMGYRNNLFIFHISTPLEFIILCSLFRKEIANKAIKKGIGILVPAFLITCILFSAFIQKTDANNSYCIIMESVILICLSLFYMRELLLLQQVTVLHFFPMFWISVAILFYFTGNLLIEGMLNYLIKQSLTLALRTYRIGYIFKYLLFVLFIVASLLKKGRRNMQNPVMRNL